MPDAPKKQHTSKKDAPATKDKKPSKDVKGKKSADKKNLMFPSPAANLSKIGHQMQAMTENGTPYMQQMKMQQMISFSTMQQMMAQNMNFYNQNVNQNIEMFGKAFEEQQSIVTRLQALRDEQTKWEAKQRSAPAATQQQQTATFGPHVKHSGAVNKKKISPNKEHDRQAFPPESNRSDTSQRPFEGIKWLGQKEMEALRERGMSFDSSTVERAGREVIEDLIRGVMGSTGPKNDLRLNMLDTESATNTRSLDLPLDSNRSPMIGSNRSRDHTKFEQSDD